MARYIHRWRTPIMVKVEGTDEHWYRAPWYDPRHLPVIQEEPMPKKPTPQCWEVRYYRLNDDGERVGAGPLISLHNATSREQAIKLFKPDHKLPHEISEVVVSKYTTNDHAPKPKAKKLKKLKPTTKVKPKPKAKRTLTKQKGTKS